jgi:hypothetical protein
MYASASLIANIGTAKETTSEWRMIFYRSSSSLQRSGQQNLKRIT